MNPAMVCRIRLGKKNKMANNEVFALYMRACLDARRDADTLPPDRLLAAFRALTPEVPFEEWCAKMQLPASYTRPTADEIAAANERAIQSLLKAKTEGAPINIKIDPLTQ